MISAVKLERGCERCGYDAHPAALQFHHRAPGTANRYQAAWSLHPRGFNWLTASLAAVEAEIPKCDVLCANCHAIEHAETGLARESGKRGGEATRARESGAGSRVNQR